MPTQTPSQINILAARLPSLDYQEAECILQPFLALLPSEQVQSIVANRRPLDRALRLLVRVLLGYALQQSTGRPGREFLSKLTVDTYGRPQCEGFCFSFSHTLPYAVCAVAPHGWAGRIGVDVESVQALNPEDFSNVFTPKEMAEIMATSYPSQELIRRWTIKEAALKADGMGFLADPLAIHTTFAFKGKLENGLFWSHLPLAENFWLTVASCSKQNIHLEKVKANTYLKLQ